MRRVLVCGGRDYANVDIVYRVLDAAHRSNPISTVITGMAPGADSLAAAWATDRGVQFDPYCADWKRHGNAAGPIRNQQMLDMGKPDIVFAFPGGKGTADMKKRARKAGITVLSVNGP